MPFASFGLCGERKIITLLMVLRFILSSLKLYFEIFIRLDSLMVVQPLSYGVAALVSSSSDFRSPEYSLVIVNLTFCMLAAFIIFDISLVEFPGHVNSSTVTSGNMMTQPKYTCVRLALAKVKQSDNGWYTFNSYIHEFEQYVKLKENGLLHFFRIKPDDDQI